MNLEEAYKGKSVFITGHTGFKGSWLTEWLLRLGARISGYSLPPPTDPALFVQLGLQDRVTHFEADIRQLDHLRKALSGAKPDFVFHLAAQSLVRLSYLEPRETYEINVMGTINVLESLRSLSHPCAAVLITTDKCYAVKASPNGNREEDALGGEDPYSSSKAAAEIAIAAYRRSFFSHPDSHVTVASARAGNVLGGGDWAADRLVPDCIRSLKRGESIAVRNRSATRPWQYVLEPISGYLELGSALARQAQARRIPEDGTAGAIVSEDLASAFNFGPVPGPSHSVLEVVEEILRYWPGFWHDQSERNAPWEAQHLRLATDKALRLLGWSATYDFRQTIKKTLDWYRDTSTLSAEDAVSFINITRQQIDDYEAARAHKRQTDIVPA